VGGRNLVSVVLVSVSLLVFGLLVLVLTRKVVFGICALHGGRVLGLLLCELLKCWHCSALRQCCNYP